MDLPQMKRAKDIKAWAEEIETFKNVVEEFTGNVVTAEKLAESIKSINEKLWSVFTIFVRMRIFQSADVMYF